jgi:hypothetical protein
MKSEIGSQEISREFGELKPIIKYDFGTSGA